MQASSEGVAEAHTDGAPCLGASRVSILPPYTNSSPLLRRQTLPHGVLVLKAATALVNGRFKILCF